MPGSRAIASWTLPKSPCWCLLSAGPVAGSGGDSRVLQPHRRDCRFVLLKSFDEPWPRCKAALASLEPTGYTRIGPALRHGVALLERQHAAQKLLLLISDGKPTDYDRYEGRYGIADVRQAMREAHQARIHTYALAVDVQAKHYLPQMFGSGNFQILPHPASGPGPHGHVSPAVHAEEDRMPEAFNKARFPLMFLGLLALLTALWGGLLRLGWALPLLRPTLSVVHGPLMVCGFLGTLIGVERARCPGGLLALCRPALHCSGGALPPRRLASATVYAAGEPGVGGYFCRHRTSATGHGNDHDAWCTAMGSGQRFLARWSASGVCCLVVERLPGTDYCRERLELSRMLRLSWFDHGMFLLAVSVFLVGLLLLPTAFVYGMRVTGVGMGALAWWLLRYVLLGAIAADGVNALHCGMFALRLCMAGCEWDTHMVLCRYAGRAVLRRDVAYGLCGLCHGDDLWSCPDYSSCPAGPDRGAVSPGLLCAAGTTPRLSAAAHSGRSAGVVAGASVGWTLQCVAILLFLITLVWVLWRRRIAPHR